MKHPQDATLRNARASRKRDAMLQARVRRLEERVHRLAVRVKALERR